MAQRFQVNRFSDWTGGGWLLYVLPLPLIPTLFISMLKSSFTQSLAVLVAIILFTTGAVATRRGLAAEQDYHRRKVASAPRIPLKLLGSLLVGAGVWGTGYFLAYQGLLFSLFTSLLAWVGFLLTYGLDPMTDKGVQHIGTGYTTDEVLAAIREAEQKIAGIRKAAGALQNLELRGRLRRIGDSAQKVVSLIEENPQDLRRARKFLNVYLDGARKVAEGYAQTHLKTQSQELESNFRNVLVTIEEVFGEQYQKLLDNDVLDLDVQIEVLSTRLKNEGVA
ncbi:MAG: 5-bromo-4-chloroindolyl phosphate hydrolysis family protein [Gammaproteobacteria bacterium]|nr:5-bromo-4-chloroindolyl phosphate hydrolysis family protein [Gammaproteobacteria bacterium]